MIYQKFYTRTMPLLVAEFWYKGEREILPRLIENAVYFKPLFIYTSCGKAEVYYETNNPKAEEERITEYFSKNPDRFEYIMRGYVDVCHELMKAKNLSFKDYFEKCAEFSAYLSIVLELSEMRSKEVEGRRIGMKAIKLREKTHTVGENICHKLEALANSRNPHLKRYAKIITYKEVLAGKTDDIERREAQFALYENSIFFDIKELEESKNIKILRR